MPRRRNDEGVVGVEQRLGVELVGDRFAQHRGVVALALARMCMGLRPVDGGAHPMAQRHHGTHRVREELALALLARGRLARLGLAPGGVGCGVAHRLRERGQLLQAAQPPLHSSPARRRRRRRTDRPRDDPARARRRAAAPRPAIA
jgi:hypothetical protein